MHKIKEMLMDELYQYEDKISKTNGGKLSAVDLESIHKLTDTIKNIDKISMLEESGYSEASDWMGNGEIYGTSYADGRGRGGNYGNGSSYAKMGRGRGSNANRDSMGRYSSRGYSRNDNYSYEDATEHMIKKAEEMMSMAENEGQRRAISKFIHEFENMQ